MGLASKGALRAGDVVTVEPGLYRQGYGGVRLEDLLLITQDGCEVLTDFPYDLKP
jgi:Xaa-Pro aminopeptidase